MAVDAGSRISFGSESDKAPYDLPFGVRIASYWNSLLLSHHLLTLHFVCFSHALEPLIAFVSTLWRRWSLLRTGILRLNQAKYVHVCDAIAHRGDSHTKKDRGVRPTV